MNVQRAVMAESSSAAMAAPGLSTSPVWCPRCPASPGEPQRGPCGSGVPGRPCPRSQPRSGCAAGRGSAAHVRSSQASCGRQTRLQSSPP